jgi:hypothetical protein
MTSRSKGGKIKKTADNVIGLFIEVNPKTSWINGIRITATNDAEARAVIGALSRITTRTAWLWLRGLFGGDRMVIKRQPQGKGIRLVRDADCEEVYHAKT